MGESGVYGTMKKTILVIAILIILPVSFLFSTDQTPTSDKKTFSQRVSGYIDDITMLTVTPFLFAGYEENGYYGINLDFTDESSNINRYLVTPTTNPLTMPGLQVSSFSLITTFQAGQTAGGRLTITHDHLVNSSDSEAKVDYELAVKYTISDGQTETDVPAKICFSSDSTITAIQSQKSIVIDIPYSTSGVVSIKEAGIYFRLTNDSPVSVPGQYASTVTFKLEAL